jgi:6-phosphofructokinase 1
MVTLVRHSGETYEVSTGLTPLDAIAGTERLFPSDWVGADGHTIAPAFATYAAPLIGPLDPPAWVD